MVKRLDNILLLALVTLLGLGLVQVYSSSYILALENYNDGFFFIRKQSLFVGMALAVMMTTALVPWKYIEKWGWTLWAIGAIGVLLTYVPGFGVRVGGAIRWLQLPFGFRFEPGELLKMTFPILFARLYVMYKSEGISRLWLANLGLFVLPILLLLKQPDFGSFAIIITVGLGLLFAFGLKWRYIISGLFVLVPAFYLLVMRIPYRRARVLAFLDPWADPENKGFQIIQSMLSFRSGGLTGQGLGQGQSKLFFLPEAHTDFALAVFSEEAGFIGLCLLLLVYLFVIFRGFQIAIGMKNDFRKSMTLGISMAFALSVFINAGVAMGMLPPKGLTLPFMSYGGSSLITLALAFGLLMNAEQAEREGGGVYRKARSRG